MHKEGKFGRKTFTSISPVLTRQIIEGTGLQKQLLLRMRREIHKGPNLISQDKKKGSDRGRVAGSSGRRGGKTNPPEDPQGEGSLRWGKIGNSGEGEKLGGFTGEGSQRSSKKKKRAAGKNPSPTSVDRFEKDLRTSKA